jgi:hypothetical protein
VNVARVGALPKGSPFRTPLTRRYGVVVKRSFPSADRYAGLKGVEVELERGADLEVRWLHPLVVVETLEERSAKPPVPHDAEQPCPGPAGIWECVHPEGLGHGGEHVREDR